MENAFPLSQNFKIKMNMTSVFRFTVISLIFFTCLAFCPFHVHNRALMTKLSVTETPSSAEESSPTDAVTKARMLLLQAQRLRDQAKAAEVQVHGDLINKKKLQDLETDETIRQLFNVDGSTQLISPKIAATRIQEKRLSLACLEKIVDRLQYRESEAQGEMHVVLDKDTFQKKQAHSDSQQVKMIQQLRQILLDAASILDQEDQSHHRRWEAGQLQASLLNRVHYMRREHEAQFLKRQQEFFEAAKRKKHFNQAGGEGFSGIHSIYGKDDKNKK